MTLFDFIWAFFEFVFIWFIFFNEGSSGFIERREIDVIVKVIVMIDVLGRVDGESEFIFFLKIFNPLVFLCIEESRGVFIERGEFRSFGRVGGFWGDRFLYFEIFL